jgi:nitrile hydratase
MPALDKASVNALLKEGDVMRMDLDIPPKFKVGDRVRTKKTGHSGHTRLARYVRDKIGIIKRDHGIYPLPDTAIDGDDQPQHVYSVEFKATVLWGEEAPTTDSLRIDLWDDYLVAEQQDKA